jgi:hypothetical protein
VHDVTNSTGSLEGAAVLGAPTTGIILVVAGLARWLGVNVGPGASGR